MIALDTNILVYSVADEDEECRRERSIVLIQRIAPTGAIVSLQVIGEFLNVCRRKKILMNELAILRAAEFLDGFACPRTQGGDLIEAAGTAARFGLQYFDALILVVACRAGATILLSEDMQDGLEVEGLRIVNPFDPANETLLAEHFGSAL